jgi:hypothetical protein
MLMPCPACHQQISSNAPTCPHCGEPLREQVNSHSSLDTAYAIFAGLFLVIGLSLLSLGAYGAATYNSPSEATQTQIDATKASGEYVNPAIEAGATKAAVIENDIKLASSERWMEIGGVCMIPFFMLVVRRGFTRKRRSNSSFPPPPIPPSPPAPKPKITMTRKP